MLQEEVDRRTIAVSVTTAKFTAQTLAKAFQSVLRKIQKEQAKNANKPQGRQSVKKLTRRFDAKTMPINGATRLFDRVVKENNLKVDYAFFKSKTDPKKNLLLFKAAQVDEITAAFSEYTRRVMEKGKDKRAPILAQVKDFGEQIRKNPREREHRREAAHDR